MGFRDDHDAALARVNALEQALAREQTDDAERDARLARLEEELRGAREKLAAADAELQALRPPPPKPAPAPPSSASASGRRLLVGVVVAVVAIGVLVVLSTTARKRDPARPRPPAPMLAMPDPMAALLEEARGRAQTLVPGGRIISMDAEGVDEEGGLHPEYGKVVFLVHRTNPAPPPPVNDRPIGAPPPPAPAHEPYTCETMTYDRAGWHRDHLAGAGITFCPMGELQARSPAIQPRCTARTIWAMARRDGAAAGAIAKVWYDGRWRLQIDDARARFDRTYDDDCRGPSLP